MSRHSFCVGLSIVIILALGAYLGSFFLGPRATAQSNDNVWYVNIGGSLPSFSTDEAMGFYPHLIVIDAGDTVVWTVVSAEDHTVTFFSGQPSFNGFAPQSVFPIPCSSSEPNVYNGTGICSSGDLFQGDQYNLTFTNPGVYVYSCAFHPGMQGIVVVQPKGSPYPYTQQQYNAIAQQEVASDLYSVQLSIDSYQVLTSVNPDNTSVYTVAAGYQPSETTMASVFPVSGSGVSGNITVQVASPSSSVVNLSLTGLKAGQSYSAQLLFGSSQYGAANGYSPINLGTFVPSATTFSTTFTVHQNLTLVAYNSIALPDFGLFIDINSASGNTLATGDIALNNGGIMGFLPSIITIHVGDKVVWKELEQNDVHTVTYVPPSMQIPAFGTPQSLELVGNNSVLNASNYYNSGPLAYGQSYVLTFSKPGVYTIQCLIHNEMGMVGYVDVLPKGQSVTQVISQQSSSQASTQQITSQSSSTQISDNFAREFAFGGIAVGVIALIVAALAVRRR